MLTGCAKRLFVPRRRPPGLCFHNEECRRDAPPIYLLLRPTHRLGEEVDACNIVPSAGKVEGVFAGAATSIENGPSDVGGYADELFVRPADVPRRLVGVDGRECGAVGNGYGFHPASA